MDKITLAFLLGETAAAWEHANALLSDPRQTLSTRLTAALAQAMLGAEQDRLVQHYVFHFPNPPAGTTVADVVAWGRAYCTEHPDLVAQVDERLRAERTAT